MQNFLLKAWNFYREFTHKIFKVINLSFVLITVACLQVSAGGYSQTVTLKGKGLSVEKAFSSIKQQTGYTFWYNVDLIKSAEKINVDFRNKPLEEALNICLQGQPFTYRMVGKTIVLQPRAEKMFLATPVSQVESGPPPPIEVKGKVINERNEPMPLVSVTIKGANNGTSTDMDGNYSIQVSDEGTLVFSFVGYATQEMPVNSRSAINVQMALDVSTLSDIVVVGYGTQKKIDVTGSITTVSGEDISKNVATNPLASLQGKVAGLTIVNSGQAGASPTVRIRGVNSTNNSNPLYVVDGIFQSNIDYLNPSDIESISVLRDPSSIAIFGILGGSGVIIVTTKRAKKGETRIGFQSTIGMQKVNNRIDVVDAEGFKKLYTAQLNNLGAPAFDFSKFTSNTDWQDLIFREAMINTNNLSVSNSSEKSTTLLNIGYNNQDGVLKYDHFEKFIVRLNEEIRFNKNIKIGGDITGYYSTGQGPSGSILNNALWATPVMPIQAAEGIYYNMPSFQYPQVGSPMANLQGSMDRAVNKNYRVLGSVFAEIKFLQHFTFKSSFYSDLQFNNSRSYSPLPFRYIKVGENGTPDDTTYDRSIKTSITQSQAEYRKFQQDHLLTYQNTFNKHDFTALAGFTTLYQGNSNVTANRRDTSLNIPNNPDYWYLGIVNANNPITNGGGGGEESYLSFLGRINYSYDNKYLLNLTYRRDGTSKFAPKQRWGDFGSVGVGWIVSKESFFDNVKGIDFLKLKGAWGTVGNALGLGSNLYLPGLNTANVGVFGDNVYGSVSPAYVPDPNLHWEVVRGLDLSIETRLLQNRLSAEFTYYDRTTKDILTTVTLPGTAGDYRYFTNLGNISNKGLEITMGWNDGIGKDFTYGISGNFSYNKNEVVSIGNNINFKILGNAGVNVTETGKSVGYFYGYTQTGIYQTVKQLDQTPGLSNSLPGDISYEDTNGDGVINTQDRTYLGSPFPPYNFGLNINLGYKNFDLLFEGQGVAGNKIYTQRRNATFAVLNYETNRLNAWTGAGTTNIEPILENSRANNYLFSTYFLEPGDYFRIRTLQLGYNFSRKALEGKVLKQMRLYVSGQNIATFSKVTGYTPEVSLGSPTSSGADNGTYPVPSIYSFGINVTF